MTKNANFTQNKTTGDHPLVSSYNNEYHGRVPLYSSLLTTGEHPCVLAFKTEITKTPKNHQVNFNDFAIKNKQ